jgi:hypothetical protein
MTSSLSTCWRRAVCRELHPWTGRRCRTSSALAAVVLVAGCIDLHPAEPPPSQPAVLYLNVRLGEGVAERPPGPAEIRVSATLLPGVDPIGRHRVGADDTLWIAGSAIAPVERGSRGQRVYSADLAIPVDALFSAPILIRPPRPQGLGDSLLPVHWSVVWREDEGTVTIPAGADLVIRTGSTSPEAPPRPSFRRWSVSVFHPEGWSSMGAETATPADIAIPAALLGPPGSATTAILNVGQSAEIEAAAGEYLVRLEVTQSVRWTVEVAPPD